MNPETVFIIIPTVGTPDVIIPTLQSLSEHTDGFDVRVVVVNNPVAVNAAFVDKVKSAAVQTRRADFNVRVRTLAGPVGFSPALNEGLRVAMARPNALTTWFDLCQHVVFLNDDVRPTHGWLRKMVDAMTATEITDPNEPSEPDGSRLKHPVADYGEIGMVGPMSNCVAGCQMLPPEAIADLNRTSPEEFGKWLADTDKNGVFAADFISGFCVMFSKAVMFKVLKFREQHDPKNLFWNEAFLPSGFEDNELCMVVARLGFRAAVAGNSFVYHLGHQSFDKFFTEARRGMANRLTYYNEAKRLAAGTAGELFFPKKNKIVAIIRFGPEVENDMRQFDVTVTQLGRVVDYIMVLYTKPKPGEGPMNDLEAFGESVRIEGLSGAEARVYYASGRDERTERNDLISRIRDEFSDATWAMSVDHDEWIEPRITRDHLERLMAHPDPMVEAYLFRFPTFWNTTGTVNLSHPWGDEGTYTGGASGWRFFRLSPGSRLNPMAQKKIIAGRDNGLHCGNVPPCDGTVKRIAAVRMKHMGYVDRNDRVRKFNRYRQLDPNPNPALIGGASYAHIIATENQKMSEWTDSNGITLVMLVSPSEDPNRLGDMLDQLYGVVDRIVLTWTGAWDFKSKMNILDLVDEHGVVKSTTMVPKDDIAAMVEGEGPSVDMLTMARHFGAEWVHHKFTTFDETRNASIGAASVGTHWLLSLDPDEAMSSPHLNALQLVRMAENTDAVAWQIRFANPSAAVSPDGQPYVSTSEAIRMWRPNRGIEWTGPVHETLTKSIRRTGGKVRVAPFALTNTGMVRSPQELQKKYDFYIELAIAGVLADPWWETGWQTIGLYFRELGEHTFAEQMFMAAVAANNEAYLPLRIAADHKIQQVIALLEESEERMGNHPDRERAKKMNAFLREQFAVPPVLTDAQSAKWRPEDVSARLQPAFLELLQKR